MGCVASSAKDIEDNFTIKESAAAIVQVLKLKSPATPNKVADVPFKPRTRKPASLPKDVQVLRKYELKCLIGEGRFSRVWAVESRLTKEPFAMKATKGVEGKYIYQSELAILSRVRHPNIIQLIETFETGQRFYLVMELATGGDLFDRIMAEPLGRFAEPEAARILGMVLAGMRHLHCLGITHRDIKPDNLLFYHPGHGSKVLISDFSIAHMRPSDRSLFMKTSCGTSEYLAPEVLTAKPYTSAVDMWALGVVAYIVLCGAFPFDEAEPSVDGAPPIKLYRLIIKGSYSFDQEAWKDVTDWAKDFIKRLLAVDPVKRLTAEQALGHHWIMDHAKQKLALYRYASSSSSSDSAASTSSRPTQDLDMLKQSIIGHLKQTQAVPS